MDSPLINEVKGLASGTMDSSMNYMNLGFTLAAALAWNESAKILVKQFVSKSNGKYSAVLGYPLTVTVIAILVFRMSRMVNPAAKKQIIVPVVGA